MIGVVKENGSDVWGVIGNIGGDEVGNVWCMDNDDNEKYSW
jgi:hypothetical protein